MNLKKITISLLVIVFLSSALTGPVYAIPTVDPITGPAAAATAAGVWANFAKYVLKEFILDLAARLVARSQLSSSLKGISEQIINSGRTGRSPAFIQNWRNFITNAEYRGEDVFRSILSNTANCPNIKKDILNLFGVKGTTPITQNIRVGNLDSYQVRGKCTLPAGWSIQNYQRDFAGNGGWDALARLSQPQNNFYGATIIAMGELNSQRNLDRNADRGEGESGAGFTGIRKNPKTGNSCDTPPTLGYCSNGLGTCDDDSDCVLPGLPGELPSRGFCTGRTTTPSAARCTFLGDITTPSKVLGEGATQFIDKNLSWLTTSDEVLEVLGSFIGAMMDKLVDYTGKTKAGGTKPDDTDEGEKKTQYEACVQRCNNTSVGSQMTTCIDRCYKQAGVDLPPNYGPDIFTIDSDPSPSDPECSDGIDNADPEDVLIDMADPGCVGASDDNETDPPPPPPPPQCSDGIDNADPEDV